MNKEQRVEIYDDATSTYNDMKSYIEYGWKVHTCVSNGCKIIVVYERELEGWN